MKVNRSRLITKAYILLQKSLTISILTIVFTFTTFPQNLKDPAETIKIGLLIQDNKSVAALQGAEMAIRMANENGGLNGTRFKLVARSMEGPWGTGSKQAIDLIFEEKVWALQGSHDGRNAHLVEQAATKSIIVFLSAWSGDPTLSQAFVPWFFNCVPNDNQQAVSLIREIVENRKFKKPAIVYSDDYDSRMMLNSFLSSSKIMGIINTIQFNYNEYENNLAALTFDIQKAGTDCIVLFCYPSFSLKVVQQVQKEHLNQLLFGSLSVLNEDEISFTDMKIMDTILSVPSGIWLNEEGHLFRQGFQKLYGKSPGMVASYSFDGMRVLIEAIRAAGSNDREKIQKSLEGIHYKGVTGMIRFDKKGNRMGDFRMMRIKNGIPVNSE